MVGHQTRWELAVFCESCGLVGYVSTFEELQYMRARHEDRITAQHVLVVALPETPHAQVAAQSAIEQRPAG